MAEQRDEMKRDWMVLQSRDVHKNRLASLHGYYSTGWICFPRFVCPSQIKVKPMNKTGRKEMKNSFTGEDSWESAGWSADTFHSVSCSSRSCVSISVFAASAVVVVWNLISFKRCLTVCNTISLTTHEMSDTTSRVPCPSSTLFCCHFNCQP